MTTTDTLLGAHEGRPLRAGETAEVRIPNAGEAEARVFAAIFEDGTTEGDSVSVSRLIQERREVYGPDPFRVNSAPERKREQLPVVHSCQLVPPLARALAGQRSQPADAA